MIERALLRAVAEFADQRIRETADQGVTAERAIAEFTSRLDILLTRYLDDPALHTRVAAASTPEEIRRVIEGLASRIDRENMRPEL